MPNVNWKNSKEYQKKYYEEVIKPKRKKKQAEHKELVEKNFSGEITIKRICPICGEEWEETLVWKSNRIPSTHKQCKKCILEKIKNYTKQPEVREKINARLRKAYAENEGYRKRRQQSTRKWLVKTMSNKTK